MFRNPPNRFLLEQALGNNLEVITAFESLFRLKVEDLEDTEFTSLQDGDMLQYDATGEKFINITGASGSFTTSDAKTVTVVNGLITNIV